MRRCSVLILCLGMGLFAAGCPKGDSDYNKGRKAETLQDYDAALEYYQKALKADPNNAAFKIRLNQTRFQAGEMHIQLGEKQRENGDLQGAAAQFQRAQIVDPSSAIAADELKKTLAMIAEQTHASDGTPPTAADDGEQYISGPPELKPISNVAITYKATGDAKILFDTIGKLAGITMIYDPDFPARRISADLNNLTLEQALEVVCLESKAFWKPVTQNIILIAPDQPQKRRDYEEESMKTFYLANTVTPQDLTEIVTGLRSLLEVKRIQQLNSQNAIIVRASPDVLTLVGKIIDDVDKAKPEVMVQVEVLEARTDRLRNLGITPGQSASIAINPNATTSTTSGSTTTTNNITLNDLAHLNSSDYTVTLPNFTANAVLTDTYTKIIQDPELRSVEGQEATLKIGDRIPIATGSFQAGVGVGAVGSAGLVNPLVNTQFQYQDVGVNIHMTPRVHPDHEVSLKMKIEVSSVTGTSTIGGISQPIISQRVVEHDIRLGDGQAYILGGLIQRTDTRTLNGWPGLAKIPIIRYLFSSDNVEHQEDEVLIMLIPHIVRLPQWTKENLRAIYTGSDQDIEVRRESEVRTPVQEKPKPAAPPPAGLIPGVSAPAGGTSAAASAPGMNPPQGQPGKLRFEPPGITLKVGETKTIGVVVDNVNDLFSIPMLLQYNPAVISIEEVQHAVGEGQHGGFLSGGTQEIAIVSNVNKEKGQAIISATRQPNTPGVSGSGTLLGIVIKGIAAGSTNLLIVQQNAKDSQQRPIPLVTSEATVQVQP
ncbi:MAG: tetratricopeptide repeat protein [Candidatus Acidiferrum sp.]